MHVSLIVKCHPGKCKAADELAQINRALSKAEDIMCAGYSGHVDYWTAGEDDWTKEAILRKDGKTVAACRAKDFQSFTEAGDPYYFLSDHWYDYGDLNGCGWDEIVTREINNAKKDDSDKDPIWFACLNVHV